MKEKLTESQRHEAVLTLATEPQPAVSQLPPNLLHETNKPSFVKATNTRVFSSSKRNTVLIQCISTLEN